MSNNKKDNEFLKNLGDNSQKVIAKIMDFFDGISQKIFDKTGKKIAVGELIIGSVTIIIVLIVAINIAKYCFSSIM